MFGVNLKFMKKQLLPFFSAVLLSVSAYAQMPVNGLVSNYQFTGSLSADSEGSNTLSTNGMPLLSVGYQNVTQTGVAFNSDGILGSTSSDFQLSSFSFSCWVNVTGANYYQTFGNVRLNTATFPYNSFILVSGTYVNNQLTFFYNTDAHLSSGSAVTDLSIQDPASMSYSTWYFVSVTVNFDATNNQSEIILYKDGAVVNSIITPGQLVYNGSPFTLGNINGATNTNNGLIGYLDEVTFYNRVLTQGEVCELYNYYQGTSCGISVMAPSNLTASAVGQQVTLNWTDNSNNETFFRVLTSTDGVNFSNVLGDVTSNTTTYSYSAAAGTHYYKVYAYSNADNSDSTNTASVTVSAPNGIDESESVSLGVYPNPANTFINISTSAFGQAMVLNSLGQTVKVLNLNSAMNTIDISDLETGLYYLKLDSKVMKFVKE
jgi:hypothetical protein